MDALTPTPRRRGGALAPAIEGVRTGVRGAARTVAFYAATPSALPRDSALDRALYGVAQVVHAARLVLADARLARAAALPTLLTAVGCLAAAAWMAARRGDRSASTLHAFAVAFVAVSSMPPTFLQRLWVRVALEARRALGGAPGELEHPGEGYLRMLVRESVKALRQFVVVAAGLFPVFVAVDVLPLGRAVSAAAAVLWAGYWVVIDALEIPMEVAPGKLGPGAPTWFERGLRRLGTHRLPWWPLRVVAWPFQVALRFGARWGGFLSRPWRHEVKYTQRHPWETLGFGVAAGVFLVIPVVGLFFRAVAMTAATAVVVAGEGRAAAGGGMSDGEEG
jgi:hypothetical protein